MDPTGAGLEEYSKKSMLIMLLHWYTGSVTPDMILLGNHTAEALIRDGWFCLVGTLQPLVEMIFLRSPHAVQRPTPKTESFFHHPEERYFLAAERF